jgi:3-phosphoshikimate 1-carboxyvinyltransferase
VQETADGLVIDGSDGEPLAGTPEGTQVATLLDHRIAMSMAVAGLVSRHGVRHRRCRSHRYEFPDFTALWSKPPMHTDP